MNVKRAIGIIFLALGIISIFLASYVAGKVSSESAAAQAKIAKGKSMFQGNPYSEMVGGMVAGSAESKVSAEVAKYNQIVMTMRIGGILLAVVGAGMTFFCRGKGK